MQSIDRSMVVGFTRMGADMMVVPEARSQHHGSPARRRATELVLDADALAKARTWLRGQVRPPEDRAGRAFGHAAARFALASAFASSTSSVGSTNDRAAVDVGERALVAPPSCRRHAGEADRACAVDALHQRGAGKDDGAWPMATEAINSKAGGPLRRPKISGGREAMSSSAPPGISPAMNSWRHQSVPSQSTRGVCFMCSSLVAMNHAVMCRRCSADADQVSVDWFDDRDAARLPLEAAERRQHVTCRR